MVKRSPPCVSHKIAVSSHASSRRRRRRRRRRVTSLRGTHHKRFPKGFVSACRRFVLSARSARTMKSTRNGLHHLPSAPREAASKHGETMTMACLRIVSNWTSLLTTRRTNDFRSPNDGMAPSPPSDPNPGFVEKNTTKNGTLRSHESTKSTKSTNARKRTTKQSERLKCLL